MSHPAGAISTHAKRDMLLETSDLSVFNKGKTKTRNRWGYGKLKTDFLTVRPAETDYKTESDLSYCHYWHRR